MPKTETSSDSGSSPDDKNTLPAEKKSKKGEAEISKTGQADGSETSWTLEKLRQVNVNGFHGRNMVNIREFDEKNGKTLPNKKCISLTPTQLCKLLEIGDEVIAALEND